LLAKQRDETAGVDAAGTVNPMHGLTDGQGLHHPMLHHRSHGGAASTGSCKMVQLPLLGADVVRIQSCFNGAKHGVQFGSRGGLHVNHWHRLKDHFHRYPHPMLEVNQQVEAPLPWCGRMDQARAPLDGRHRILMHCDLDAFFAAVETLHHGFDPAVPLIIGSDPKQGRGRGIVSTCNYAARVFGVRSAMPISEAWRRCPAAPFGPARYISGTRGLYRRASRKVMEVLGPHAQAFEVASIDEAYMDITDGVDGDWDAALALAKQLQNRIMDELNLSASFGIGPTRILAKMASEEEKPHGIHRVMPDEIVDFFRGRSLRAIPGIGPKRATQLAEWGYQTADEVHGLGELGLERLSGPRFASWFMRVVEGESSTEVSPLRSRKSIGKEHTFSTDQTDHEAVLERLSVLVDSVMKKARSLGLSGRLGEVKIRYTGFETHTTGRSIPVAMDDTDVFWRLAQRLFAQSVDAEAPVRLIGFRLGHLEMHELRQTTLFGEGITEADASESTSL
jgi:nucleotidyltransferase/DNA polymerase involved in DNA repair